MAATPALSEGFRFCLASFSHPQAEEGVGVQWGRPDTEVTDALEEERDAQSQGSSVKGKQREPWSRRLGVHCSPAPPQLQM